MTDDNSFESRPPLTSEILVVHPGEAFPEWWDASVFLAGPLPRSAEVAAWNAEAIALLRRQWQRSGRLVVFTPEPRSGVLVDYTGQVEWEHAAQHRADAIVFWVPRDMATMPALTTNIEWGTWYDSGKVVFGAPASAPKNEYLRHLALSQGAPTADTLEQTVGAALDLVGAGARRHGGECSIPLLVWRVPSFQRWYRAQREAGNTMQDARLEWTFRVGADRETVVYWALHVRMYVAAEERVKDNEVVLARPDVVQVLLYRPGATVDDTELVLVREFRSPASTPDGFVHELPGGSGPDDVAPAVQAVDELQEETGFVLDGTRLRPVGTRQVAATVSAHQAHVFAAEITETELAWLRSRRDIPGGVGGSERTWIEITTYRRLRDTRLVDWATLGMVAAALAD